MRDRTRFYWLHLLSSTHVGTGRGLGYIDLPICREKVTGWPYVPGSALKGVWRDHARADPRSSERARQLAFGRADGIDKDRPNEIITANSGALQPTDARLVCLPIRSFRGTFAWCTSRMALKRLRRDLELAGYGADLAKVQDPPADVPDGQILLTSRSALSEGKKVYLEDYDFDAVDGLAQGWADRIGSWVFDDSWRAEFARRFAILPDAVFDFLCETGTEVNARVRIDEDTKTVADGALWYEESLPPETILAGFVACDRVYDREKVAELAPADLLKAFATGEMRLQVGGKATVGRGRVRCVFTP